MARRPAPWVMLLVLLAGAVAATVPASPASAATAWPFPTNTSNIICNTSVAGMLPTDNNLIGSVPLDGVEPWVSTSFANRFPNGSVRKNWVGWSYEMGFSFSFACIGARSTTRPVGEHDNFNFQLGATSKGDNRVVALNGHEAADAQALAFSCPFRAADGFEPECNITGPGGDDDWLAKARHHSYAKNGRSYVIRGRLDIMPYKNFCEPGQRNWPLGFGPPPPEVSTCITDYDKGVTGWIHRGCPAVLPRYSGEQSLENSGVSCVNGYGNDNVNDTGSAVPLEPPDYTPPGGPIDEGDTDGECSLGSWLLTDTTSNEKWNGVSAPKEIKFVGSHTYTLRISFSGKPPAIDARIRQSARDVWTKTSNRPASPLTFAGITGINGLAVLTVTGYAGNGDIDPACQTTVTDEDEGDGKSRYDQCIEDSPGIEWDSPSTWAPGLGAAFVCAMQRVFVPEKGLEQRADELRSESGAVAAVGEGVTAASAALTAMGSPATGSCSGPSINVPPAGAQTPLSLCSGSSLAEGAYWAKRVAELGVGIGVAVMIWNMIAGTIWGARTITYRMNEDGGSIDHNESGSWS